MKKLMFLMCLIGGFPYAARAQELLETPPGLATAIFAGGCFWCMEKPFEHVPGVSAVYSGYTGGKLENPTYKQVSSGMTGHREAVAVLYDPAKVKYETLLTVFWRNVDPFDAKGQFCDKGMQYTAAIFPATLTERKQAEASLKEVAKRFGESPATTIMPAGAFYKAEPYHQDYYKTDSIKYWFYRNRCGRDARLDDIWGDDARAENLQHGK